MTFRVYTERTKSKGGEKRERHIAIQETPDLAAAGDVTHDAVVVFYDIRPHLVGKRITVTSTQLDKNWRYIAEMDDATFGKLTSDPS